MLLRKVFQILLCVLCGFGCNTASKDTSRICFSETLCVEPDGRKVYPNGDPIEDEDTDFTNGAGPLDNNDDEEGVDPVVRQCVCAVTTADADGDCIPSVLETLSNPSLQDTDSDGLTDGCEDINRNGAVDLGETNPVLADTDSDGLLDGMEDTNKNGYRDRKETHPLMRDTDGDGIADGVEDRNRNGLVEGIVFVSGECVGLLGSQAETDPVLLDSDTDGVSDGYEDKNRNGVHDAGEMFAWHPDSDCDGVRDGREDLNKDGLRQSHEMNPLSTDSDGDGLSDGLEDSDGDGLWSVGVETSPLWIDSDGDSIPDAVEDRNRNGVVEAFVDMNNNGCWDKGQQDAEPEGESNPRLPDSDGDGLRDTLEDLNRDGRCEVRYLSHPVNPGVLVRTYAESCASVADTDCDGLSDGVEDVNKNHVKEPLETDPLLKDTDFDGLWDSCAQGVLASLCEDLNRNGRQDPGESNPLSPDSDGDGLLDGCERTLGTDVLNEDTDSDGSTDGEEDANKNCMVDNGETDPKTYNAPPDAGTSARGEWNVCAAQNVKEVTYASSSRHGYDYRLAFEVEKNTGGACGVGGQCPSGFQCENAVCVAKSFYWVQAYGKDAGGTRGFSETDLADELWGHSFQSARGVVVDPLTQTLLHRQVYGFVHVLYDDRPLDDILNHVRTQFQTRAGQWVETANLPARKAHDDLPKSPVLFAQRQMKYELPQVQSALVLRNSLLTQHFLQNVSATPASATPSVDPALGDIVCTGSSPSPLCSKKFVVHIGAVQRLAQRGGPHQKPLVLLVLALTPDDFNVQNPQAAQNRFFADRVTRLEDLTGGSALARYAADTSKACDKLPRKMAKADVLWMIDDSRSMQQMIGKLQRAAQDAPAVLAAHSNIIDFRVAMTTTNPSSVLPGGGGTYYYEDTQYLDCDSSACPSGLGTCASSGVNACNGAEYLAEFAPFYNGTSPRSFASQHAGFLASEPSATCSASWMDLTYKANAANSTCTPNSPFCCKHLTASCADGPTVLASGMCDLIRSMGGLPAYDASGVPITSGTRQHSAPEQGVRSLRRLLSASSSDPKKILRTGVPLATVVLSDEEDFWFKDDCQLTQSAADKTQLPSDCYHQDGNLHTRETCTLNYCNSTYGSLLGTPSGYNPDAAGTVTDVDGFTLQWRSPSAAQCSVTDDKGCYSDPCTGLGPSACGARQKNGVAFCSYAFGQCRTVCANAVLTAVTASQAYAACVDEDLQGMCKWDASLLLPNADNKNACVLAVPFNDCQACKRLVRQTEALDASGAYPGLKNTGPLYAIIRDKGAPGSGADPLSGAVADACNGGAVTWGRGDGQAYRDLATSTQGRTHSVCASNYQDFMQVITADMSVLSRPYPLSESPIASTLRVGLLRPKAGGGVEYVEVPRSRSRGFIYDATRNTLGFRSDPIDGVCAQGAGCSANGSIETAEIDFARDALEVPKEGDTVVVSYRFWLKVPCGLECEEGAYCLRQVCTAQMAVEKGCEAGALVDACVDSVVCPVCESYQESTASCMPVGDTCACNPGPAWSCNPQLQSTCPMGYSCSDGCVCEESCSGDVFQLDGTVSSCEAAQACCEGLKNTATPCCAAGEAVECATDALTGVSTAFCAPEPCECACGGSTPICCPGCARPSGQSLCVCLENPQ
jgi:hypothetical protein